MQYLLQNKVNYLSNTKIIYTNDISVNRTSNFILYNSDVNTIHRFNYNYVQQTNRTSFNILTVKGASQSEAGSCKTRAYKVNNIIYMIRLPFTCSNYFAIKDEDTLTLTIDVDGTSASTSSYATRKSTSTLQYSCGYNSTGSDVVTGNITVGQSNVIDCGNNVLTSLKYRDINGPVIEYTCKNVYPNVTSNVSVNKQDILNTTRSNYIKGFNIKTNSFDNPSVYWSQHDYADTLPLNRDEYTTIMDNDFFSVSCGNRGISGMQNNGKNIVYGCGDDELYNLHVQSYELPYDPVLNKYYDSGMLFDKVKCKDDEVLSSFHKTITPTGPAVKWVCGKLM